MYPDHRPHTGLYRDLGCQILLRRQRDHADQRAGPAAHQIAGALHNFGLGRRRSRQGPRRLSERRWSRLWAARDGLGAIEFGFIAPVLVAMLLGILDFGLAFWQQMEIANAADAGAQW